MFKRFSVKIFGVATLWALSIFIVSMIVFLSLLGLDSDQALLSKSQNIARQFNGVLTSFIDMETGIRGYLLSGEDSYLEPFNNSETSFEEKVRELEPILEGDEIQAKRLKNVKELKKAWLEQSAVSIMMSKKKLIRGLIYQNEFVELFKSSKGKEQSDQIRKIVSEAVGAEFARADTIKILHQRSNQRSRYLLIFGIPFCALCGLIGLIVIVRSVESRMKNLYVTIEDISVEIRDSGASLSNSSRVLSEVTMNMASSMQETASSVHELSTTTNQTQKSMQLAVEVSEKARGAVNDGLKNVTDLIALMIHLKEKSEKISDSVSVIDDIAFQTNLLALNAAVEAANAGEFGRGFSVVADAVRALAQKSLTSSRDINKLATENKEHTQDGTKSADVSSLSLKHINESVATMLEVVEAVAMASREQTIGINQISTSISSIDLVAQKSAMISASLNETSDSLNEKSIALSEALSSFSEILGPTKKSATKEVQLVAV